MKLTNENVNYSATVVRIHNLIPAENSDNLAIFPIHGMSCIVAKEAYDVGQMGIVFPAECQLSDDFCSNNNLYTRSGGTNKDPNAKGYIEHKRRVKAIKLRGNKSTGLFMPLTSLDYLGIDTNQLVEGESFTHINGTEVCRKYVVKTREPKTNKTRGQTKKFRRIENKTFPEHWDTDMFLRNMDRYKDTDELIITQKLHGTSARFTNQAVLRKLTWKDKVAKFFGANVSEYEYDTLAGSRRVIKDIKAESDHAHFYGSDLWNQWLEKVEHVIPKNWVLYGEIVGWVGDSLIQKGYSYRLPKGENELYIYRITIVNEDGVVTDLSWDQIKHFCTYNGLKYVPELERCPFYNFFPDKWVDINYNDCGYSQAVPLDPNSPCDEGVCIRREGGEPYVTKLKSPEFYLHETVLMDEGVIDTESAESV